MGNCCGKWLHTYRSDNRGDFTLLEKKVSSRPCHWNFETAPLENGFIGGSEVDDGISTHKSEKTIRERAKAAVLASFVADAATMGLHWCAPISLCVYVLSRPKSCAVLPPKFSVDGISNRHQAILCSVSVLPQVARATLHGLQCCSPLQPSLMGLQRAQKS